MLFNSYTYLLLFLPLVALVFHLLRGFRLRVVLGFLVVASVFYYGWYEITHVPLILGSCVGNFFLGRYISRHRGTGAGKAMLATGVTANLALLGYYKYTGLLAATLQQLTGWPADVPAIILPLAISFFTFQQVAYLVDAWRGETEEYHFTDYLLFVTFFPQLIAGPIVHHKEMLPQFSSRKHRGLRSMDLSVGVTFIALGLFKKVVLADYLARTASPIFDLAAADGRDPTTAEAWAGVLAYTLQIYFDFSGYSDMAIGSARIFGIRLPLNFHSPYKAASIVEFWRHWHITLSRFLRDYLYIPLGGNRKGKVRRYANLLTTMLLGGLWHGAGWTFLVWGGLHGLYLCINHAWQRAARGWKMPRPLGIALTFSAVVVAWVFFRAKDFDAAWTMFAAMAGHGGGSGWPPDSMQVVKADRAIKPILAGLLICWALPNTQQFMRRYLPALDFRTYERAGTGRHRWWHWRPTVPWALFTLVLLYAVGREFDKLSEFIYFQF
jgi:D-alanyl-lipoteichoic acid acyltransferase DltB (MBOAT superfamily)